MKALWLDEVKQIYVTGILVLLLGGCAQGQWGRGATQMEPISSAVDLQMLEAKEKDILPQGFLISKEQALEITNALDQVKALNGIGNNRFQNCIETTVVPACESDWVTCVDNAWVIKYGLRSTCPVKAEERFGVTFLLDATSGDIISEYPEIEYFQDVQYCRDDNDCYCYLDGAFPPDIACVNFVFAPLVGVGFKPCAGCICRENHCTPTRKLPKE